MTVLYKFLQAWGPRKLESMRGCPVNNYQTLVSHLAVWQARVSRIPVMLVTKGKLLLLNCGDIQADLGECRLPPLLPLPPPSLIHVAWRRSGVWKVVRQGPWLQAPLWSPRASPSPGSQPFPCASAGVTPEEDNISICSGSAPFPFSFGTKFPSPHCFLFLRRRRGVQPNCN